MSPFSVEKEKLTGESFEYQLGEGPFLLSTEPEAWIDVRGDEALIEIIKPDSEKASEIFLKRAGGVVGAVVYDAGREEHVYVRWNESPERDIWKIIENFDREHYHPYSAKILAYFSDNLQEFSQKHEQKKGLSRLAGYFRQESFEAFLFYLIYFVDFCETLAFFPQKLRDTANGKLEKMLEEKFDFWS